MQQIYRFISIFGIIAGLFVSSAYLRITPSTLHSLDSVSPILKPALAQTPGADVPELPASCSNGREQTKECNDALDKIECKAPGFTKISIGHSTYDFSAPDLAGAFNAIQHFDVPGEAGKKAAITKPQFFIRYKTDPTTGKVICAFNYIVINIITPNWTDVGKTCPEIQKAWNDFLANVNKHEEGHKDAALKILNPIQNKLLDTSLGMAKRITGTVEGNLIKANRDYHRQVGDTTPLDTNAKCKCDSNKKGSQSLSISQSDDQCKGNSVSFSLFNHKASVECKGNVETGQRECAHYTFYIDGGVSGKFKVEQDKIIPVGDWSFKCSSVKKGGVFFVSPLVIEFTINADTAEKDLIQFSYKLDDPDKGLISLHAQGAKTPTSAPCELRSTAFQGDIVTENWRPTCS